MTILNTIWVDLDETLICSSDRIVPGWIPMGPTHWAILRPGARECLAALRSFGTVRLLTSAPLSYAVTASEVFYLGFQRKDIIGQELWTSFLGQQPSLGRRGDVLVEDDQSRAIPAKCGYIGIPTSRVLLVPAFTGRPDDALATVPQRVEQLMRPRTPWHQQS